MTKKQVTIISILAGTVVLAFLVIIIVLMLPQQSFTAPTPIPTPTLKPLPTITTRPILPNFLPTPGTPTKTPEPTVTNTRLPTLTPTPFRAATPTVIFSIIPTRKPPTPISPPATIFIPPTITPIPVPSATNAQVLQYQIYFEAKETNIVEGDCTELEWDVTGSSSVLLDGRSISNSDIEEVCPKQDTTYTLTVQLTGSRRYELHNVTIFVEPAEQN